jgi:hypothetical protein
MNGTRFLLFDLGMRGRSQLLGSEIVRYFLASIAESGRHGLSRVFPLGECMEEFGIVPIGQPTI